MFFPERPLKIGDEFVNLSDVIVPADQLIDLLEEAIRAGIHPHEVLAIKTSDPLTSRFVELLQVACHSSERDIELTDLKKLLNDSTSLREVVADMLRHNQERHFNDGSWSQQQAFGSDIY